MKINISVAGKYHLFNLAQQLEKHGHLSQLITSYPKFEVVKFGIPKDKVNSVLIKEIVERAWRKIPVLKHIYNQHLVHELFDKLAMRSLKPSDIFVGTSSTSLHTLRAAKQFGAVTIIERASSHISFQDRNLEEEYNKCGIKIPAYQFDPRVTEKELCEYEEADYVFIPSSFVKKTYLDFGYPAEKLVQIPYGVELSQFKQIPKEDNIFRVIFAGASRLIKGVHYLLQAFSELDIPNSELLLIGSVNDEMKPFFKKYEGKFRCIGHIPQKDLYKHYSQGSVFVLNSIDDGFGYVIPQAMACGLPVICTTNTGGPDVVREGKDGFIIPIRNVEALKNKLMYLFENPGICRQMGQSAKERVAEGFTWDDYGERMIAQYRLLL